MDYLETAHPNEAGKRWEIAFEKKNNINLKKKRKQKSPNQAGKKRMEEEDSSSCIGEEQTAVNSWTMIWIHVAQNFVQLLFLVKKKGHKHRGWGGFIPHIEDQFLLKFGANKSWGCCKTSEKVGGIFVGTSPLCALIYHGPFCLSLTCHTFKVTIAALLLGPSSCRKLEPR